MPEITESNGIYRKLFFRNQPDYTIETFKVYMNHTLNVFVLYLPQEVGKPSVITSLDVIFCSFLIFKQVTPIVYTNPKSETALMCLKSFLLS